MIYFVSATFLQAQRQQAFKFISLKVAFLFRDSSARSYRAFAEFLSLSLSLSVRVTSWHGAETSHDIARTYRFEADTVHTARNFIEHPLMFSL